MAHLRKRHALFAFKKKFALSPIVALQGARQTGKSFFAKEILGGEIKSSVYVTLDQKTHREAAERAPEVYLERLLLENRVPVIDEAQKVPDLFDALKFEVDQRRRPGRFVILGSTDFSKLQRIRESLTGRMSRLRLYPFNTAEAHQLPASGATNLLNSTPRITRKDVLLQIDRGGLPGICFLRSEAERSLAIEDLVNLVVFRDSQSFRGVNSELILEILNTLARLEIPSLYFIAKTLKQDPRRIQKQLEILCELFFLTKLNPHPLGKGKPLYYFYDSAVAKYFEADELTCTKTWFLNEILSQKTCRLDQRWNVFHYQTSRGSQIPFIVVTGNVLAAYKITLEERIKLTEFEILNAFRKKSDSKKTECYLVAPVDESFTEKNVKVHPLTAIV